MKISSHATKRMQQRCIPENLIDLIILFGTPIQKPGSATEYRILKKDKSNIMMQLKYIQKEIEKASKKAVLISKEGDFIITTYNINTKS